MKQNAEVKSFCYVCNKFGHKPLDCPDFDCQQTLQEACGIQPPIASPFPPRNASTLEIAEHLRYLGHWKHPEPSIGKLRAHAVPQVWFVVFLVINIIFTIAMGMAKDVRIRDLSQANTALSGEVGRLVDQNNTVNQSLASQAVSSDACERKIQNYRAAVDEAQHTAANHAANDPISAALARVLGKLKRLI